MSYKKLTKAWVRIKAKDNGMFKSSEYRYEEVKVLGYRSVYDNYRNSSDGYYLVKDKGNLIFEVHEDNLFRGDIE